MEASTRQPPARVEDADEMVSIPKSVFRELVAMAGQHAKKTGGAAVRPVKEQERSRALILRTLRDTLGEGSISDLERLTQIPRRYLRQDLIALQRKGAIKKLGHKRDAVYTLAKT